MIGSIVFEFDVENVKSNLFFKILIIFMILILYIYVISFSIVNIKNIIVKIIININFNSGNNVDVLNVIIVV